MERAALEYLVANMPGHGFVAYSLRDAEARAVSFDALALGSLAEAEAALRALEAEHGALDFEKEPLVEDLRTLRAADLVDTVERALATWRERPWARSLSFETFCETLLPHRGSNEPFEDWHSPSSISPARWSTREIRALDTTLPRDDVLATHASYAYDVASNPSLGILATAGWDGFVGSPGGLRLLDLDSGAEIRRLVDALRPRVEAFLAGGPTVEAIDAWLETCADTPREREVARQVVVQSWPSNTVPALR